MKKNLSKKILSIFLSLAVAVTFMPTASMMTFASEKETVSVTAAEKTEAANATEEKAPSIQPVLLPVAKSTGKKAITLKWNSIDGATKYVVYASKCGKKQKKVAATSKTKIKIRKAAGKKLVNHKEYKMYVAAYRGSNKIVQSRSIHFILGGTKGKYANVKKITVNRDKVILEKGNTYVIVAKTKVRKGKKHIKDSHGIDLKYYSDCPQVAYVQPEGIVKAKAGGTTTIYVQDIGGKYKKIKVTVIDKNAEAEELQKAKEDVKAAIKEAAGIYPSEKVQKIIEDAFRDIDSTNTHEEIDVKIQIILQKVETQQAREDAAIAIKEAAGDNPSGDVKKIIDIYIEEGGILDDQTTKENVEDKLQKAIDKIESQQLKESKEEAMEEIIKAAGDNPSDAIKDIINQYIGEGGKIDEQAAVSDVTSEKRDALEAILKQKAKEAEEEAAAAKSLAETKEAAKKGISDLAGTNPSDTIQTIIDSYIGEDGIINQQTTKENVEEKLQKAIEKIKAQQLKETKEEAKIEIEDALCDNPSDAESTAANNAKSAIDTAETIADAEKAKNDGIKAIQQAHTAHNLAAAKEAAKQEINAAAGENPSDAVQAIINKYIIDNPDKEDDGIIDKAENIQSVEQEKQEAIEKVNDKLAEELAAAKAGAKEAIANAAGADPSDAVNAIKVDYNENGGIIDEQKTIADVNTKKDAAITKIEAQQLKEAKKAAKQAIEKVATPPERTPGKGKIVILEPEAVEEIVVRYNTDDPVDENDDIIDSQTTIADVNANRDEAIREIEEKGFRVIKANGNKVELLAMSGEKVKYNETSSSTAFKAEGKADKQYQQYAGSTLDKYLNETYYGSLPAYIKNAIVRKSIDQHAYEFKTSEGTWSGTRSFDTPINYGIKDDGYKAEVGKRYVYALEVKDAIDYLEEDGELNLTAVNVNKMFYNSETKQEGRFCWLRSAGTINNPMIAQVWAVGGFYGDLNCSSRGETLEARAAFTLDWVKYKNPGDIAMGDLVKLKNKDGSKTVDIDTETEGDDTFRVLNVNEEDNTAELLAMSGADMQFGSRNKETTFSTVGKEDKTMPEYSGSELDNYLDGADHTGEYYSALKETLGAEAIKMKTIEQHAYKEKNTEATWSGTWLFSSPEPYGIEDEEYKAAVGNRYIYALEVKDVIDYLKGMYGNADYLTAANVNKMFFDSETQQDGKSCWLRSAVYETMVWNAWLIGGSFGNIDCEFVENESGVRAAFTVDLDECSVDKQ